jgi:cell wall-associated NlpC family hydrolase
MIDTAELRRLVVEEALSWVHTPYHHGASVKGVGVDCVWILIRVYQAVGRLPVDYSPGQYSREWYLHKSEEIYLSGVQTYASRLPEGVNPLPADIALYKVGHCVSHGAIIVDDELLIHANRKAREVEISLRRSAELEKYFHSYWTPFP